jgi:tetratricopeptide (TPR) repeat protein
MCCSVSIFPSRGLNARGRPAGLTRRLVIFFALLLTLAGGSPLFAAEEGAALLAQARTHLAKGRYEEAIEVFERAGKAKADPVLVALGESQARQAVGAWEEAEKTIDAALSRAPQEVRLLARRGELHLLRGRLAEAEKVAESVRREDRENLLARLVLADVYAETGRSEEANEAYRWFIRYYNERQPEDAVSLLWVAEGAIQYARWNHNTQIFHFVVNTLCPDALKNDPNAWRAHLLGGSLLLEKFNREQAVPELEQAITLNPRAAEAIVLLGQDALDQNDFDKAQAKAAEALKIDPRLPSALRLKANAFWSTGRIGQAYAAADAALAVNPRDPHALALAAACALVVQGLPPRAELEKWVRKPSDTHGSKQPAAAGRFAAIWTALAEWNPKPGVFLSDLGGLLESRFRFDAAEVCYRRAVAVTPQLPEAKSALGMLLMRIGKLDEAHTMLDEAFQADPFHMRVSNFRKVLKLLDGYQVITTDHFVIRVDSQLDKLLGGYMADYLEEIYPQLVAKFGFAPPQRTQFEVFNKSGGTSGHEWFSARMVGMPWIQTIGASTGVMVAMASPTSAPVPFNWARVLRHEFVHVITVQQTGFNIPHWFTEALAVLNEGYPPPSSWDKLLVERLAKGNLRTLETIDTGFQRPANSDDWQFTYCQSRLYAEYMLERGGPDALKKMLAAYREQASTPVAIKKVFGVEMAEFEKGYRAFLERKAASLPKLESRPSKTVEQLEKEFEAKPGDPDVGGAYAWALLEAGNANLAKSTARHTLAKQPNEVWSSLVLARLEADQQQYGKAIARLNPLLDRSAPQREVLLTLVKLKLLDEKPAEAAELAEIGIKHFPLQAEFLQGQAAAYAQLDDAPHLARTLEQLCESTPDDVAPRRALAELALRQKHYTEAIREAKSALYVDVLDAQVHRVLGEAYLGVHEPQKALAELEAAAQLKPKDDEVELALAKALAAAGKKDEAKTHFQAILDRDAKNAEARTQLEALK